MKFSYYTLILLLFFYYSKAQVGINTTSPKATLDIHSKSVPDNTEGILIPRINLFPTPPPTAAQDGMLVFVTGNGTPSKGFYYWDNTAIPPAWIPFGGGSDVSIVKIDDLLDGKSDNDGTQNGSSVFIGVSSGASDNSSNNKNVGVGFQTLQSNITGERNTAIGFKAGLLTTGDGNIYLGTNAGSANTSNNKLFVDNTNADANNALLYGEFGNDNTPSGNILRTNGELQVGNPNGAGYAFPSNRGNNDQVLVTNGSGATSWQSPPPSALSTLLYPDGINKLVAINLKGLLSNSYTVPNGKNLYITSIYADSNSSEKIIYNGATDIVVYQGLENNNGYQSLSQPLVAKSGQIISSNSNNLSANGFMVDATVTPVVVGNETYIVPTGKIFVLTNCTGNIQINSNFVYVGSGNTQGAGSQSFLNPIFANAGDEITSQGSVVGYLLEQ